MAQSSPCSSLVDAAQMTFEASFKDSIKSLIELNRTINITLHLTKTSEGTIDVDMGVINQSITDANSAFDPIKVKFRISSIDTIDNYQLDNIRQGSNDKDLIARYYTQNMINLFLVSQLNNSTNQNICGYAFYPAAKKDVIIIRKNCLTGTFLIEQLGHLFNLYHTHETAFGVEQVNESNCAIAGDLCCDTKADPNLSGKVNSSCELIDLPGYLTSAHNYMSFTLAGCKCYFSTDQYLRMINTMLYYKNYLW